MGRAEYIKKTIFTKTTTPKTRAVVFCFSLGQLQDVVYEKVVVTRLETGVGWEIKLKNHESNK
ncbi:MAG: hypothetical protein Aureis2KO_23860 [Aureisphaera sp.]